MAIPNPIEVAAKNRGKKLGPSDNGLREDDDREMKIIKQTQEMMEMISKEVQQHYRGVPILIPLKYAYKETVANLIQEFNDSGMWKASKQLEEAEDGKKVWLLRLEAVKQEPENDFS